MMEVGFLKGKSSNWDGLYEYGFALMMIDGCLRIGLVGWDWILLDS
jgi:hypothetical protein